MSPTARTLHALRKAGHLVAVVERWIPQAKVRRDLYGFGDILAVSDAGIWAVQVSMTGDRGRRLEKLQNLVIGPRVVRWLRAGGHVFVIAWTKHKPAPGRTLARWSATATQLYLEGLEDRLMVGRPRPFVSARPRRAAPQGPTARGRRGTRRRGGGSTRRGARADGRPDAPAPHTPAPGAPWRALVGWPTSTAS